ncbi:MAG: 3-oxoacyl-[acyl-carrier-protein] reductase [Ignavibacteriales bacterium CG_4_9_14_3_um_filter_34_10]|nr:MAG: 3-oxoacyl-[acyl-carrier-protein] reductase [Ignavibacteriales bacterium CG_4_9_14_3_um_filter_34_10]
MAEVKKVLVTGGARGIGHAIVNEFLESSIMDFKSDVAFVYNNSEEIANKFVSEMSEKGARVFAIKCDVSSFEQTQNAVKEAITKLGGLDILINNAGITKDNLLLRMSEEEFDRVISVNLKSVYNFSKAVLKPMIQQKWGRIVNITSIVGLIGNAGQANYAASKSGMIGFTKSLAKEIASRGITVNAIAPGFIETEMTHKLNEKQREVLLNNIPLKRLGRPEDIAKAVRFLCSENASYITGQVISVDGGMTM